VREEKVRLRNGEGRDAARHLDNLSEEDRGNGVFLKRLYASRGKKRGRKKSKSQAAQFPKSRAKRVSR